VRFSTFEGMISTYQFTRGKKGTGLSQCVWRRKGEGGGETKRFHKKRGGDFGYLRAIADKHGEGGGGGKENFPPFAVGKKNSQPPFWEEKRTERWGGS